VSPALFTLDDNATLLTSIPGVFGTFPDGIFEVIPLFALNFEALGAVAAAEFIRRDRQLAMATPFPRFRFQQQQIAVLA
jgi:hypothetical protein